MKQMMHFGDALDDIIGRRLTADSHYQGVHLKKKGTQNGIAPDGQTACLIMVSP